MKNVLSPTALLLFFAGTFSACRPHKEPPVIIIPDFSYSGVQIPGEKINFQSTITKANSYAWNFGDGSTSSASMPEHAYANPGEYTVSLTLNGDVVRAVSKTIYIYPDPVYTHLIGSKTRLWSHTYSEDYAAGVDTTYYLPDTSFAVSYIDPITILVGPDTLRYVGSTDSVLSFIKSVQDPGTYNRYKYQSADYYWGTDSIHFRYTPVSPTGVIYAHDYYTK